MRSADAARPGRPAKVDGAGVATRERLLAAAVASCVEHGFEGATVDDIAARADVSGPAIYKHFGGKVELLVAAGQRALDDIEPVDDACAAAAVVRAVLSPGFADNRRMLVELHLAGRRYPEVADLLARWQAEHAAAWRRRSGDDAAAVATFFALLVGLCQIDALVSLGTSSAAVSLHAERLASVLFPDRDVNGLDNIQDAIHAPLSVGRQR
ncbi:MAG: helix-turn-helix domain-containing protein [Ilumatobacteraceae bacterium]